MRTFYRGQNPVLPGNTHRRLRQLLVIAPVVLSLYLFLAGDSGFYQLMLREQQIAMLAQEIADLKAENRALENEAARLADNLDEIERIAREHYGMIRPHESVFMVYPNPPVDVEAP